MEQSVYRALALQVRCQAVNGLSESEARPRIMAHIKRIGGQLSASKAFIGDDVKLVVLPEYFLTSFPARESIAEWQSIACLSVDGAEYEALGKLAQDNGVYLSGNVYELDKHFPDLYFQTSFCIAPYGDVVLRYRRLNSMFAPTPHDVWDKYLDIYGLDGVFPVAKTDIGRLAAVASEEILYPEITRCMVLRGAEVILHSSSEASSDLMTQKEIAKVARAIESMAYVVSANSGGIDGINLPGDSTNGHSTIIDPHGHILAQAAQGETIVANAEIDLELLRRNRRRPGMSNYLARQRLEVFAQTYTDTHFYPANTLKDGIKDKSQFTATQKAVIQKLSDDGII
ncbi:MAG: nitrilase-related carbon-nitrogen hydrolase [Aggregatilineales bacterium]